jgi:hypothetical protein
MVGSATRSAVVWLATVLTLSWPALSAGQAPAVPPVSELTSLPVSLDRIFKGVAQLPPSNGGVLRITESVEVLGNAPELQLWDPETAKLVSGPVPFGAPTHRDFVQLHTPIQHRTPAAVDFHKLMLWLFEVLDD